MQQVASKTTNASQRRFASFRADIRNAVLLAVAASAMGMVFVSTWGSTPSFCQEIFGPPVMWAYGRGYTNPDLSAAPALKAFLNPDFTRYAPPAIDEFAREDLPETVETVPFSAIQQRQLYLLVAAGAVWKLLGVSWSALTPLYGLLYGLSAAAFYGLFRLCMRRLPATFCVILLISSPIQLNNLVRLRDYSKAPFILLAILILGLLLKRPMHNRALVGWAAVCGAVLGLGLGFRFDVMICAGAFIPLLLFFTPACGSVRSVVLGRIGAVAAFGLVFVASSWPVLAALPAQGDKYHPSLMGFAHLYDARLGVGSDYQLVHRYLDAEPIAIAHAYSSQTREEQALAEIETPEYEAMVQGFYGVVLTTFPADIVIRAYMATLRILDELRAGRHNALPRGTTNQFLARFFELRGWVMDSVFTHSRYAALLTLLIIAGSNLRLGFGTLFMLLYFGGYTSNQFASRNYFHLEFFGIWAGGFLLGLGWDLALRLRSSDGRRDLKTQCMNLGAWTRALGRAAVFLGVSGLALSALLWGLRGYQSAALKPVLERLSAAETKPLDFSLHPLADDRVRVLCPEIAEPSVAFPSQELHFEYHYIVASFDTGEESIEFCADYAGNFADSELDWSITLPRTSNPAGGGRSITRLAFPVYHYSGLMGEGMWTRFRGIEVAKAHAPRLSAVHRITDTSQCPIPLTAVLGPEWRKRPAYQRLRR